MEKKQANALILFARDPVPGTVKTRLLPLLGTEKTYQLYMRFLRDSIAKIQQTQGADMYIGVTPSNESGFFSRFDGENGPEIFVQQGADLGEKMKNAFMRSFEAGYERVVIIGADSPSLPVDYIQNALGSDKPLQLGPSTDGGYYLIGMAPPLVDIFQDVNWGSDKVLRETLARITEKGADLELLPIWYDVDRPEDLRFLKTHLQLMARSGQPVSGETGAFLETLDI